MLNPDFPAIQKYFQEYPHHQITEMLNHIAQANRNCSLVTNIAAQLNHDSLQSSGSDRFRMKRLAYGAIVNSNDIGISPLIFCKFLENNWLEASISSKIGITITSGGTEADIAKDACGNKQWFP
nr:hypothetical protein [Xylella fastidiosa]